VQKGVDLLIGVLEQREGRPARQTAAPRIEIAVLPGCPWCSRALRILRTLDLLHTVTTINDDAAFQAVQQRSGMTTFPQVFIDGSVIGGYDDLAAMQAAGELDALR
jgi:glutaredoxin